MLISTRAIGPSTTLVSYSIVLELSAPLLHLYHAQYYKRYPPLYCTCIMVISTRAIGPSTALVTCSLVKEQSAPQLHFYRAQ